MKHKRGIVKENTQQRAERNIENNEEKRKGKLRKKEK